MERNKKLLTSTTQEDSACPVGWAHLSLHSTGSPGPPKMPTAGCRNRRWWRTKLRRELGLLTPPSAVDQAGGGLCPVFSTASFLKPFNKVVTIAFPNEQRSSHTPEPAFRWGGHGYMQEPCGSMLLWARQRCCCAMACWKRVGVWGVFLQPAEKSPKLPATQMGIWWPFYVLKIELFLFLFT